MKNQFLDDNCELLDGNEWLRTTERSSTNALYSNFHPNYIHSFIYYYHFIFLLFIWCWCCLLAGCCCFVLFFFWYDKWIKKFWSRSKFYVSWISKEEQQKIFSKRRIFPVFIIARQKARTSHMTLNISQTKADLIFR